MTLRELFESFSLPADELRPEAWRLKAAPRQMVSAWFLAAVFVGILAAVKTAAIRKGPSADHAMVAVRVAQRDVLEAKSFYTPPPAVVREAEAALRAAADALAERRYEDAIVAARAATARVRRVGR
ncbi:MAG TPA: hypothetical protein VNL14_07470 [Candidatus Acidoferrales bacterium]|nr:hypothetical protein [Candidatus Acidoferrales bacterium]